MVAFHVIIILKKINTNFTSVLTNPFPQTTGKENIAPLWETVGHTLRLTVAVTMGPAPFVPTATSWAQRIKLSLCGYKRKCYIN